MSNSFPSNANDLILYNVLQRANLQQYYDAFMSQGGDDVNQLCEAGEEEFLEMMALVGMASKPLHVRRLQKTLLEWILHPAMFSKSMSDRRSLPLPMPSRGSIYAAVQQQQLHHITGAQPANGGCIEPPSQFKSTADNRNFQAVRQYTQNVLNNPATPNSDEFSDPDGSVASIGTSSIKGRANSPLLASTLSEEHITLIASVADELSQNLPGYAPKPLNMKKPADKELQEIINHLEDDPTRIDILRKYTVLCGRADSKRKLDRPNNLFDMCINEAAAQLCRHRPSLLTRRDDLLTLATQVLKETGLQFPKETGYSGQTTSDSAEPRCKSMRTKSPTVAVLPNSPKRKSVQPSIVSYDDDTESIERKASAAQSLLDEGLRISRQYGLGPEFEEELQAMKKEKLQDADDECHSDNDSDRLRISAT